MSCSHLSSGAAQTPHRARCPARSHARFCGTKISCAARYKLAVPIYTESLVLLLVFEVRCLSRGTQIFVSFPGKPCLYWAVCARSEVEPGTPRWLSTAFHALQGRGRGIGFERWGGHGDCLEVSLLLVQLHYADATIIRLFLNSGLRMFCVFQQKRRRASYQWAFS